MIGDGFEGVPARAPYDRIVVTAAAEHLPQTLIDQLADDGVMILPLGPHGGSQHIIKLTKSTTGIARENLIAVRFVPLLPGKAQELYVCRLAGGFGVLRRCGIFDGSKPSQPFGNS